MKLIKTKDLPNGNRRVTVDIEPNESLFFLRTGYYKLSYPHEDIVHSDQLIDAVSVTWCVTSQKWVE
jgi:hypothetical protein